MRIRSGFTTWMLLAGLGACGSSDGSGASEGSTGTSGPGGTTAAATTIGATAAAASSATTSTPGTGSTGATSETGDTGSTGGTAGTGSTGDTGSAGDTGSTAGTGSTGDTEDTEDTGGEVELGPGALQFIGVNSDLPEGFALVALTDIPSGTELRFTERAWNDTNGAFEISEGTGSLVLSAELAAGTVFEVGVSAPSTLSVTPEVGAITNDDTGNWGIAGNGDNLFVYTGSDEDPTFIAGVAFSSPSVWTDDGDALDGQSSMIPSSLSEAAGTITTFGADNLRYTGARTGEGSVPAYLALIADETNYETGNAAYTPLAGTDFTP